MPKPCIAFGCNINEGDNDSNGIRIRFHRFPLKKERLLATWVKAVSRADWTPKKSSRICSQHFRGSDYQCSSGTRSHWLLPGAVPSIFPAFSPCVQQAKCSRPPQKVRGVKPDDTPTIQPEHTYSADVINQPTIIGDTDSVSGKTDKDTQTEPSSKECKCEELKRKVKTLQQKVKRKEKKLDSMIGILNKLKSMNLLDAANLLESCFSDQCSTSRQLTEAEQEMAHMPPESTIDVKPIIDGTVSLKRGGTVVELDMSMEIDVVEEVVSVTEDLTEPASDKTEGAEYTLNEHSYALRPPNPSDACRIISGDEDDVLVKQVACTMCQLQSQNLKLRKFNKKMKKFSG